MHFAPNIYLAAVDERGVVLDLDRDRYFGLSPALTRAALLLTGRAEENASDAAGLADAKAKLLAQGILCVGSAEAPPPNIRCADLSHWPSLAGSRPPPPAHLQVSALRALAETAWSLRHRPYRRTIGWLRREKRRVVTGPASRQQDLLDALVAVRPWFPIKPICRLDAAALCVHLWRHGCPADLVFGVRLDCFGAHCWAQHGEVVVNDAFESTRQYTPIMSI